MRGSSVVEAWRRVREKSGFSESRFSEVVPEACEKAAVRRFGPGQHRRAAARMPNAGADPAAVATFLGRESPQATRRLSLHGARGSSGVTVEKATGAPFPKRP
jgi:hypothetical protein